MKRQYPTAIRAAAVTAVLPAALLLTGCAASSASSPSPAPTVTVTTTATATPAPAAASPDDPLTALGAWTACTVLAQKEYVDENAGSVVRPFAAAQLPVKNPDGTFRAIVGITPSTEISGGIVAICDIGGTVGAPTLKAFVLKDI
jgi:hypothetical protein